MKDYLMLMLSCLMIVFIPGYLLYMAMLKDEKFDIFQKLPIWFCLGIAIVTLPGIAAYIFHFTFQELSIYIVAIMAFLLLFNILRKDRSQSGIRAPFVNKEKEDLFFLSIITILTALVLVVYSGLLGGSLEGDALNFIAFVRKLVENPLISNRDAYYREIAVDPTYGYNTWHLSIALVSWFARVDPVIVWIFLPSILTPIIFLSFYLFANTLFKSEIVALISLVLFIFYYGINQKMYIFSISPYNIIVTNFLVLPVALTFAFKYLRDNSIKYLAIACFLAFVTAAIHLFGFLLFQLSLFSFYVSYLILGRNVPQRINILRLILISLIIISPYLALRLPTIKITNPYYLQDFFPDRPNLMVWLSKTLCYVNPKFLMAPHYHTQFPFYPRGLYIISFCLTPFLSIYVKKYDYVLFFLSNMLIVLLITQNPILVPFLAKIITFDLVYRIAQLAPFLLVLGFLSFRLFLCLRKFLFLKKCSIYFLLLILILLLSNLSKIFIDIYKNKENGFNFIFDWKNKNEDIIEFVHKKIQKTSVFLCDERLSLLIPAFTKHYVMVTHPGHASPATIEQSEREEDAKKVLYHQYNIYETISILEKYDVKYVILNSHSVIINQVTQALSKFEYHPQIFQKIYEKDGIFIFEVTDLAKVIKSEKVNE